MLYAKYEVNENLKVCDSTKTQTRYCNVIIAKDRDFKDIVKIYKPGDYGRPGRNKWTMEIDKEKHDLIWIMSEYNIRRYTGYRNENYLKL